MNSPAEFGLDLVVCPVGVLLFEEAAEHFAGVSEHVAGEGGSLSGGFLTQQQEKLLVDGVSMFDGGGGHERIIPRTLVLEEDGKEIVGLREGGGKVRFAVFVGVEKLLGSNG